VRNKFFFGVVVVVVTFFVFFIFFRVVARAQPAGNVPIGVVVQNSTVETNLVTVGPLAATDHSVAGVGVIDETVIGNSGALVAHICDDVVEVGYTDLHYGNDDDAVAAVMHHVEVLGMMHREVVV
jgi:hypothetical protein